MKGSVFKRCPCPQRYGARGERRACKLRHGSWAFVADAGINPATGNRRQVKRGGFATKADAEAALAELVDASSKGTLAFDDRQTVRAFLDQWLEDKIGNGLRPKTAISYRQHIHDYFGPHLGHLRLRDLRPGHIEAMLTAISKPAPKRRPLGPASVRRVHATLHSALASAKRKRLIAFNPATDVELPSATRPKVRPWEPAELGRFLDSAANDPLGPLFEVAAATGLRRGEVCGLRWQDIDLERGRLVVRQQIVALGRANDLCPGCGRIHRGLAFGRPKTSSGEDRVVDLDPAAVGTLMAHRLAQDVARQPWGDAYSDHGLVFAREDGTPLSPERVTKRFAQMATAAGLPPSHFHMLRHGWASLLLASGTDIALVSKLLGHSSIGITSDTYSHLLEGVGREAARRAAALVPRNRPNVSRDQSVTIGPDDGPDAPASLAAITENAGA